MDLALDGFTLTNAGRALLSAATVSGDLIFTRGQIGSGALSPGVAIEERTALVNPISDMALGAPSASGDMISISCQFTNADGAGFLPAFRWNEAGLFAKLGANGTETLLAYANTCDASAGDAIPATACEFEIVFEIAFAGAAGLKFTSEGLTFATTAQLASHTQSAGSITAGELGGKTTANSAAQAILTDAQVRNIAIATAAPTSANNGDIWLSYTE